MSSLVTIRRCATLPEALITASFLQSRNIPASLDNYHHASVNWLIVPALNGIGVSVPATDVEIAKHEIIATLESEKVEFEALYGTYEMPPPVSKAPVLLFWATILGIPWLVYSLIVAVLELLIPARFVPELPRLSEITNACPFGYSCLFYDNLSYSMNSIEFSLIRVDPQAWADFLIMIALHLFGCWLLYLFGLMFSRSARRLLARRQTT